MLLPVYVADLFVAQSAFPAFAFAMLFHSYFSQEIMGMQSALPASALDCCKHPADLYSSLAAGTPDACLQINIETMRQAEPAVLQLCPRLYRI